MFSRGQHQLTEGTDGRCEVARRVCPAGAAQSNLRVLELAEDVVDRRAGRKAVVRHSATDSRCAAGKEWRSSPPACPSCAVARRVSPQGSAAPAAPTPHPADRSDILPPLADKSGGAPPSTLPFAITVNPVTVNHAIHRDATPFWVRFFSRRGAALPQPLKAAQAEASRGS